MCGIVGIIGKNQASPFLLEGLKKLEYRGYDSAGIATLINGKTNFLRAEGKLKNLEEKARNIPVLGTIGIGHTRWATHGIPSEENAHPQATNRVAVVHNGIIENYVSLKKELQDKGHIFTSETDTEIVTHQIEEFLKQGYEAQDAIYQTLQKLEGAFALAILIADHEDRIYCAKKGSPLVIGFSQEETFLASDGLALAGNCDKLCYLEDGDWAVITNNKAEIFNEQYEKIKRDIIDHNISKHDIGKGNYRHFMHKEIFEQPGALGDTLHQYIDLQTRKINIPHLPFSLKNINRVSIIGCGSAFYAGKLAKYWFEKFAKTHVEVDIASEFRYRDVAFEDNQLAIFVSQSGETADTLAALRYAKTHKQHILSVVNVPESSIARESDVTIPTIAGPEIGVASTKAFTTQLIVLLCLALKMGTDKKHITEEAEQNFVEQLTKLPGQISEIFSYDSALQNIAKHIMEKQSVLFMARGTSYPIALEGALKLKELSYIHAEAYAAGELKHGPIALIDKTMPIIALAPDDKWSDKTLSNIQEVLSRNGDLILLSEEGKVDPFTRKKMKFLAMPRVDELTSPILYSIPMQLLAYHTAILKGTDVDQPRNLAKSVTVE